MAETQPVTGFFSTIQAFLINLGLGSPITRFVVGAVVAGSVIYILKPSASFNPDGSQKTFFLFGGDKKSPKTVFHPLITALAIGVICALFL